jgi:uncharacterized phage infection (PIP) family protein YhgE
MTILGKIMAILVFFLSVAWLYLTANLYSTRAEWKKAYTDARKDADQSNKLAEERIKQLILERQAIDARQQAADDSVKAISSQLATTQKKYEELLASSNRMADATAQLTPTIKQYDTSIKKVQDQVDKLTQENATLSVARDQSKMETQLATNKMNDAILDKNTLLKANEDLVNKLQAAQDAAGGRGGAAGGAVTFRGEVLAADGDVLAFNGGLNAGVKVGQVYKVSRNVAPFFVGYVTVTKADPQASAGTFTPPSGQKVAGQYVPKQGDTVETR